MNEQRITHSPQRGFNEKFEEVKLLIYVDTISKIIDTYIFLWK